MKVLIQFDPSAVAGERAAIESGSFPFRVHGCLVELAGTGGYGLDVTVEGPDEVVLALLSRAGYEPEMWEVLETGRSKTVDARA